MAEHTQNLNLIKPAQDEQYDVDDFNDNFDLIDDFAGRTPPRALTADKLTTGAKINGVTFKGDTDIVAGAHLYSSDVTYHIGNLVYIYDSSWSLRFFRAWVSSKGKQPPNPAYWQEYFPNNSLTADKLKNGAKINGVTFAGDTDIVTGLGWYSNTSTYKTNDLVCIYDNNQFKIYQSLQNNNKGHSPLTSPTYWQNIQIGIKRNLGEIVTSSLPLNDEKLHLADGSLLKQADYPELLSYINKIYTSLPTSTEFNTPIQITNLNGCRSIAYGNNIYVANCVDNGISTSQNGETWLAPSAISSEENTIGDITFAKGKFWIITLDISTYQSGTYTGRVYNSPDGVNWTKISTRNNTRWSRLIFGNNTFIALTPETTTYYTSTDGITWSKKDYETNISSICFDGTKFLAYLTYGNLAISKNGIDWEKKTIQTFTPRYSTYVIYNGIRYVAIERDGNVYISEDGLNWDNKPYQKLGVSEHWGGLSTINYKTIAANTEGYISIKEEPYTNIFTNEQDWQETHTEYGECGKYVYDPTNNTLRIPLYGSYFMNTVNTQKIGDLTPASIPNITGSFGGAESTASTYTPTGAFYADGANTTQGGSSSNDADVTYFDASKVSSVYNDNATTVNTQSIKQLVYIAVKE